LERFLNGMSSLFFAGLIAVVLLQVVARMFLPRSPHWTEEASRFLMLYMVAFAAGLAAKERAYVNVDIFINLIKGRPRAVIQLFVDVMSVVLIAVTVWYGWKNAAIGSIQTSASLGIPMHLIYGGMVLHSGSILLYTVALIFEDLKAIATGDVSHGNAALS
jgi:TRAP-type C4-dicarboxylate transport system permease small subunit